MTALFQTEALFAWYSIGLATGFFLYLIINLIAYGTQEAKAWMG